MAELMVTVLIVVLLMVIQAASLVFLFRRYYRHVPPGKVLIRTGIGGPRVILSGGVFVIPALHRADWIHAEVEILNWNGRDLLVQLGKQPEEILRAFDSLGQKTPDEIRRLLKTILDSADTHDSAVNTKLAEVGYRVVGDVHPVPPPNEPMTRR